MARRVVTTLLDDLDGSEAAETVSFALDGANYEIDLSESNARRLRALLGPYIEKGSKRGSVRRPINRKSGRERSAEIRAWAALKGKKIKPHGRIPNDVVAESERDQTAPVSALAAKRGSRKVKDVEFKAPA